MHPRGMIGLSAAGNCLLTNGRRLSFTQEANGFNCGNHAAKRRTQMPEDYRSYCERIPKAFFHGGRGNLIAYSGIRCGNRVGGKMHIHREEEDECSQQSGEESRQSETQSHCTSNDNNITESCSERELSRFGGEEDSRHEISRTILQEGEEASSGLGDNESSEDRPMQASY
ncbi:colorectal mutant cancer protein [Trichonephila inaurata madagascariensis]|uniref:Colorectal mutant cancer protein n=1 Tax=Trichonephila inaurata madagascariensis TaxID=2747483 RepID=A0A8X6YNY0_9ARAC|nr:colorectal mutant cancer protein [Trichonephila inaurata madagascariensis]